MPLGVVSTVLAATSASEMDTNHEMIRHHNTDCRHSVTAGRERRLSVQVCEICPGGVDTAIEAAGFRYPTTMSHKVERAVGLETDTPDILTECMTGVRKFGVVSIIGDYVGFANHFPIGQARACCKSARAAHLRLVLMCCCYIICAAAHGGARVSASAGSCSALDRRSARTCR
jgi:hypothetical protein